MKPSPRDYPLGLASPLECAAIQSRNIKSPSKKEAGLDVSHHALVSREGKGENFSLDILFHRMSEMAIFRQLRQSDFSDLQCPQLLRLVVVRFAGNTLHRQLRLAFSRIKRQ
jgi:hypothetical protein